MARIYRDSQGNVTGYSHTPEEQQKGLGILLLSFGAFLFVVFVLPVLLQATPFGWIVNFFGFSEYNHFENQFPKIVSEYQLEGYELIAPSILLVWSQVLNSGFIFTDIIVNTTLPNKGVALPSNTAWFLTLSGSSILSFFQVYGWFLAWKKLPLVTCFIYFFPLAPILTQIFIMWLLR